jgi:putative PIN family toxin of toxin-antitoxin system
MSLDRLVIDTNVVVSAILFPGSVPARALLKAQQHMVLASDATKLELLEVLKRDRFDAYIERNVREGLAAEFVNACKHVDIPTPIRACRDPRDDKFLELAVHGHADLLVTGDDDLLILDPFQGVQILTPADFLAR